eukprot:EG_transcript_40129
MEVQGALAPGADADFELREREEDARRKARLQRQRERHEQFMEARRREEEQQRTRREEKRREMTDWLRKNEEERAGTATSEASPPQPKQIASMPVAESGARSKKRLVEGPVPPLNTGPSDGLWSPTSTPPTSP